MELITKVRVIDDHKVEATIIFEGFTEEEATSLLNKYKEACQEQLKKTDIGSFVEWATLTACTSNQKLITARYL